ncbi:MAG: hypothetical protein J5565_06385 [Muribaculaceae bacterium]|nr:hypothetical protein [Muribaculaceae bacterium]
MKQILTFLFLMLGITAFAQKNYVTVTADNMASYSHQTIYLTGDVPSDIRTYYYYFNEYDECGGKPTIGSVLNLLSKNGFTVDQMCPFGDNHVTYLLSKASTPKMDSVEVIPCDDGDVTEVARYNIQGFPVNEEEKGIQIVVYSNYTTKTVIVE